MQNLSVMFKGVDAIEFARRFPNNDACLKFLEAKKWKNGYHCVRCGCKQYVKGKTSFHRRCRDCAYDESVTANTLFHDMHLPLMKAFYLLFRIVTKKKGMSTVELAGEVSVQQKTAWLFKRKIQVAMRGLKIEKLSLEELILAGNVSAGSSPQIVPQLHSAGQFAKEMEVKRPRNKSRVEMINPDKVSLKGWDSRAMGCMPSFSRFG